MLLACPKLWYFFKEEMNLENNPRIKKSQVIITGDSIKRISIFFKVNTAGLRGKKFRNAFAFDDNLVSFIALILGTSP